MNDSARRDWTKTKLVLILGIPAVIIAGYLLAPKSLEWHAKNLASCLSRKDVNCIVNYANPDELSQVGLTKESFRSILTKEFLPQYKSFTAAKFETISDPTSGYIQYHCDAQLMTGKKARPLLQVSETDSGVKASFILLSLMYYPIRDKYYHDTFPTKMSNTRVMYYKWMQDEGKRYQSEYGMTGILMNDSKGLRKFSNFEETLLNSLTAEEKAIAKIP